VSDVTQAEASPIEPVEATTPLEAGAPDGIAMVDGEVLTEKDLVDEGDIAADYIEELLDITDIDGDIDIDAKSGRAYVSVTASEELTRLAVQNKTGRFSRLILDIGGSRDQRAAELATLVDRAVARIEEGAASASLPPMSSYERKIVHDIVAERGFTSESEGEGRDRHTVISRR
jgi:spoIIIJ-associated protein